MKAVTIAEHGGLDVVAVREVAEPRPTPGEVVLEVRAASLNHLDVWVRKGGRAPIPMPHILGSDAAGVVAAVGEGVRNVRVGDEVVVHPGLSCGACESCRRGEQSECVDFGLIGLHRPGVFAERAAVPAANVHPKPALLSFEEAACLGIAYLTAFRMLFTRAKLRPGETVLIHGIGGGVALAALQFVVAAGGTAIVTSGSDEKLARAKTLGAAHGVNYTTAGDVAAVVRELTRGRGVDLCFNTVGAAGWAVDLRAARKGGRVVLCGVTTGAEAPTNLQALYWNQLSLLGSTLGSQDDLRAMLALLTATGLKPIIDSAHPFADAPKAMARLEAGEQFGEIALRM
jgi:NADPH:quinone reductase-like Zn-dependent oxidoreductase